MFPGLLTPYRKLHLDQFSHLYTAHVTICVKMRLMHNFKKIIAEINATKN